MFAYLFIFLFAIYNKDMLLWGLLSGGFALF